MGLLERVRKELACLTGAVRALRMTVPISKNPGRTFPDVVAELAARHGGRTALLSEHESMSYQALDRRANAYARWACAQGIGKGDTVALLMPNRPEYLAAWIGITRAGGVVALLNTNLTGRALAHCIGIVSSRQAIVAAELLAAYRSAEPFLTDAPPLWVHGEGGEAVQRIEPALEALGTAPLGPDEKPALTIEDRALFIYTSGTTGMPKAANINHYRLMAISHGFAGAMNTRPTDRMYVCLPMYHTVGGVIATGATLVGGGSVVIRPKFSAREFWDDIVRWECTMFQYIGELCRYLVNAPPGENEARHRVRLCCGNGMRPDVWPTFVKRFRVPTILEFYAATEGNIALFNFDGTEGAVGRIPWWAERRFVVKVVKFDVEAERPVRGPDGFCIECDPDEVGEVIGQILNDPKAPANRFEGYADKGATEGKILRDVFRTGDAWFRSGDLMRKDARGYFYFVDRIGDTFRWKGENVATSEVSEALTAYPGVRDANVYGVPVPGRDGRAGMAALAVDDSFDLGGLFAYLRTRLPDYARPCFLRLQPEIEVTGTFKQRKLDLVREGFDPALVPDQLFVADLESRSFRPLDAEMHRRIVSGDVRL